jgi:hypothetical protein
MKKAPDDAGALKFQSPEKSVLRKDRSAETIVDANLGCMHARLAGRVGFDRASKTATRYTGLCECPARAEIEVLALEAPVVGEGVFDARADGIGNLGIGMAEE